MSLLNTFNGFGNGSKTNNVDDDQIMLEDFDDTPAKKETGERGIYLLIGRKIEKKEILGTFEYPQQGMSYMTVNQGMDWIRRFTSIVLQKHEMDECGALKTTDVATWVLGWQML